MCKGQKEIPVCVKKVSKKFKKFFERPQKPRLAGYHDKCIPVSLYSI